MEQENVELEQQNDEVLETAVDQQDQEKKKKREAIFEMTLFFVLGILIGITLKTEAVKKITIGFDDYQLPKPTASYDVTALKSQLDAQMAQQQAAAVAQQQIQQAGGQAQDQGQAQLSADPTQAQVTTDQTQAGN